MADIEVVKIEEEPGALVDAGSLLEKWLKDARESATFFETFSRIIKLADASELSRAIPEILVLKIRKICSFPCIIPIVLTPKSGLDTISKLEKRYVGSAESKKPKKPKKSEDPKKLKKPEKTKEPKESKEPAIDKNKVDVHFVGSQRYVLLTKLNSKKDQELVPASLLESTYYVELNALDVDYIWNDVLDVVGFYIDYGARILPLNLPSLPKLPGPVGALRSGVWSNEFLQNNLILPWQLASMPPIGVSNRVVMFDEPDISSICDRVMDMLNVWTDAVSQSKIFYDMLRSGAPQVRPFVKGETFLTVLANELLPPVETSDTSEKKKKDKKEKKEKTKKTSLDAWSDKMSDAMGRRVGSENISAFWFDMLDQPWILSRIYLALEDFDFEGDARLEAFLQHRKEHQDRLASSSESVATVRRAVLNEQKLRYHYIHKFGYSKYESLELRDEDALADHITAVELRVVEALRKRDDELLSSDPKKEPWKAVAQKMRYEVSQHARVELYRQLRKWLQPKDLARAPKVTRSGVISDPPGSESDWLRSKTGLPIICPHVRDLFELTTVVESLKRSDDIRDYLIRRFAMDTTVSEDAYYCRICGESIAVLNNDGITKAIDYEGYGSGTIDDLQIWLRKQVSWIVSSSTEFIGGTPSSQDMRVFIDGITSKLYPWIDQIDRKLSKARTLATILQDNYKRLLTAIYTYAMLLKIILENPKRLGFKGASFKSGRKRPDEMLNWISDKITLTYGTVIRDIGVEENYTNTMLLRAYDSLARVGKSQIGSGNDAHSLLDYILMDPMYKLLVRRGEVASLAGADKASWTKIFKDITVGFAQAALPQNVLGATLDKIESSKQGLYDQVDLGDLEDASALAWLLRYTKSGVYRSHYWNITLTDNGSIASIGPNPAFTKLVQTLNKSMVSVREADLAYQRAQMITVRPLCVMQGRMYPGFRNSDFKYLSYTYGIGAADSKVLKLLGVERTRSDRVHEHKWNIYVYVPTGVFRGFTIDKYKPSELHIFKKSVDPALLWATELVMLDRYCEICGHSFTDVPDPSIRDAINDRDSLEAFYDYYSGTCPAGQLLHEWKGSACSNCGITHEMIDSLDLTYYKKYLKRFQERNAQQSVSFIRASSQFVTTDVQAHQLEPDLKSRINEFVEKTYPLIHTGSDMSDSKFGKEPWTQAEYKRLVEWIGSTENMDIDAIRAGIKTTPAPRRNRLHSYISSIFIDLDKITWIDVTVRDHDLRLIIDAMPGVNKRDLQIDAGSIQSSLSGLSGQKDKKGRTKQTYYSMYQDLLPEPDSIVGPILHYYLLSVILELQSRLDTKSKKLPQLASKEILLYIIHTVLRGDALASKLKAQRVAEIEAIQSTGEIDPTSIDNDNTKMYDDLVDPDYISQFGYEEMDYGGENDSY